MVLVARLLIRSRPPDRLVRSQRSETRPTDQRQGTRARPVEGKSQAAKRSAAGAIIT